MKTTVSFLLTLVFFSGAYAQDLVWGVNNDGELIRFQVNTGTNPFSLTNSAEIGTNALDDNGSSACGIYGNYIYYIPYGSSATGAGSGQMDIRSIMTDGTSDARKVNNFDLNGGSNDDDLAFVRLGFDKNGVGWMVAKGDGNVFYVGKFTANGSGGVVGNTNTNNATGPSWVGTFTITGGSDLGSGDLAFDAAGSMYLLVNTNSGSDVSIYVISAAALATHNGSGDNTNLTSPKWTLQSPDGGGNFAAIVNGIAFASNGSLYISDATALYYVDAATVNNPAPGNVLVKKIADTGGNSVHDLATSIHPNTSLPVEYGAMNAQKADSRLKVTWQALQEHGVKNYVIEVSNDGENWVTIGSLDSKAAQGVSGQPITYEFTIDVSGMAIAGFGLLGLLLPLFKSRAVKALLLVLIMGGVLLACSKDEAVADVKKDKDLWVRIVQNDINGGSHVSKIIKAVDR